MTNLARPAPSMDPRVVEAAKEAAEAVVQTYSESLYGNGLSLDVFAVAIASELGAAGWIRKRRRMDGDPLPTDEEIEEIRDRGATA